MNIPHSEEEKEEDFLEYLYMGWKSGTEIRPHQVKMHLELTDAELKCLDLEKYRAKTVFCVTTI